MKIQYTAIIFILIAIPILLVVSYYIGLQIDTITLQTTYNTKLLASTKEALEAFEINTVEWNNQYSDVANSRRRNVEASINTFTKSLANNLGISGINQEYLEAYLPAVLYTLYDGYYIYAPTETYETVKDENGLDVVFNDEDDKITPNTSIDEGTILYKAKSRDNVKGTYKKESGDVNFTTEPKTSTTEHTLLPFTSYSEQIGDITVNYTLDNYIKISGNFGCDKTNYGNYGGDKSKPLNERGSAKYVQEEGHLLYNAYTIDGKDLNNIYYNDGEDGSVDIKIEPENLTENVRYKDRYKDSDDQDDDGITEEYIYREKNFAYIYIEDSQGDKTKLYYEDDLVNNQNDQINRALSDATEIEKQKSTNNWFTLNSKDERVFLSDNVTNVTQYVYKKVSLPAIEDQDGFSITGRYINFYQVLNRRIIN